MLVHCAGCGKEIERNSKTRHPPKCFDCKRERQKTYSKDYDKKRYAEEEHYHPEQLKTPPKGRSQE